MGAAVRWWARATEKMSPTPALFSLPEARTRFTVSLGAEGRGSDLALGFPFLPLKMFQGRKDFRRRVRSWPLPGLTLRERRTGSAPVGPPLTLRWQVPRPLVLTGSLLGHMERSLTDWLSQLQLFC